MNRCCSINNASMSSPEPREVLSATSRVHLVGYRATGKSAVAQLLALRLGWDWIDADVELELRAGKSIAAIFADDGESAFRDLESAMLAELIRHDRRVLATGGGIVLRAENRELLRSGAVVVWLKARAETILRRLSEDWTTVSRRPNLTSGGLAEIREMLGQRTPLYRQCADLEVDTDEKTLSEVAAEIIGRFRPTSDV
jgi:shikimate kinase